METRNKTQRGTVPIVQEKRGFWTHPPLNAPTGLRKGRAADGVSSEGGDVLKFRADRIGSEAGREHARSAEGTSLEDIVARRFLRCSQTRFWGETDRRRGTAAD